MNKDDAIDEFYQKWRLDTKQKPLTRTQYIFAKFLINHAEDIIEIGNLDSIFKSIRKYSKENIKTLKNLNLIK